MKTPSSIQLDYLRHVLKQLEDSLAAAPHQLLSVLVELVQQHNSLVLPKAELMTEIEARLGRLDDANFRKRTSKINEALRDEEQAYGVELSNTKAALIFKLDENSLNQFSQKNTVKGIQANNQTSYPDESRLVPAQASSQPLGTEKRQVMLSYSWDQDQCLQFQRQFIAQLQRALAKPPSQYAHHVKIGLFRDYVDFIYGQDLEDAQDEACQASRAAVILYTDDYQYSKACQREKSFFLTDEGRSKDGKKVIIVPFKDGVSDLPEPMRRKLAAIPTSHRSVLDLFESGTEQDKHDFIQKLVKALYDFFEQPPEPAHRTTQRDVMAANQQFTNTVDLGYCESTRASHHASLNYEQSVEIVPHLQAWARSTDPQTPRLFYLLGDFGAGKSTVCQLLTQRLMEHYQQEQVQPEEQRVLPIYLDLKHLLNAFEQSKGILQTPIEQLIETMLQSTGATKVDGAQVMAHIRNYPSLLIVDGFDEVGQKLSDAEQKGLLNKIIEVFPKEVYHKDLKRLQGQAVADSKTPINSRLLLTCRTHFFSSFEQEEAFRRLSYRSDAGENAGGAKNYQTYYLLPFTHKQIQSYLMNWLGEVEGKKACDFIDTVHDLSGLAERPVMLQFIRQLMPELVERTKHTPNINAATLYETLFQRVLERDGEKHLISRKEKFSLLAAFAVYLWQQRSTALNVRVLADWFEQHYTDYNQIKLDITNGKWTFEHLLQDLYNASLLVRNGQDDYQFAHTSFFEFFLACGIFNLVRTAQTSHAEGFDIITHRLNELKLSQETMQFLLDWRLTSPPPYRIAFDQQWQELQQQAASMTAKKLAFDLWYFAYQSGQDFPTPLRPNWSGLRFDHIHFKQPLNLAGADLSACVIQQVDWRQINLRGANLSGSHWMQAQLTACQLDAITGQPDSVEFCRFWQCSLDQAWQAELLNTGQNMLMPQDSRQLPPEAQLHLPTLAKSITPVAYSPDGQQMLFGDHLGILCVLDLASGSVRELIKTESWITFAVYSPNGQLVLFEDDEGVLGELDLTSSKTRELARLEDQIMVAAYSPDGQQVLLSDSEGTLCELDLTSGKTRELAQLKSHQVMVIAYSPDGQRLLFGDIEGALRELDLTNGKTRELAQFRKIINSIAYSPDGQQILFGDDEGVLHELDLTSGKVQEWTISESMITSVAYRSDDQQVLFGDYKGIVRTLDLADGRLRELTQQINSITSIAFSPDGLRVLSGGSNGVLCELDLTSSRVRALTQSKSKVTSIAFNPDGQQVLFGNDQGVLSALNLNNGKVDELNQSKKEIMAIAFSHDGQKVLFGSFQYALNPRLLLELDLTCGKVRNLSQFKYSVTAIAFSPNSQQVLLAGQEGILNEFDITNGKTMELTQLKDDITVAVYSPDGLRVLLGDDTNVLYELDLTSGKVQEFIRSHEPICSIAYSPDGQQVLLGGYDGALRFYNTVSQEFIKAIKVFPDATLVYANDDLTQLVQVTGDAWRYLTAYHEHPDGRLQVAPPTAHPRWTELQG